MGRREVREAAVAGSFYPGDRRTLSGLVESLIASVRPPELESAPSILIVPHAGYPFSGQTAAYAYRTIKGRAYDAVILVGPSHHVNLRGAAVYDGDLWTTPLGEIPVDKEIASRMIEICPTASADASAHEEEHCLEVQLPFLQKVMEGFGIVPIVTLLRSADEARTLAQSIVDACSGRKCLLVGTSDLYHGYSYEECVEKTDITVEAIMKGDASALQRSFAGGGSSACGEGAILTALSVGKLLGVSPVFLHKTNSGDVMGSRSGYVVGYSSFAFV